METLQSTIFIEFDVNTKKITFLRNDSIVDYDSNVTNIYVRVKYKNLSGNTVYLTPSQLESYKFSLYTIKPATNNVNVITGKITDELKGNNNSEVVKFELPETCTNRLGIVKCEIHINQEDERIASSRFILDVKQSLVTEFDNELLGDEDFPVLKQLIFEIQKASNIDDSATSPVTTYSSDKIEDIKGDLDSKIEDISNNIHELTYENKDILNNIFNLVYVHKDLRVWGHRCMQEVAPENTLIGVMKAKEYGLKGVEFDVYKTSDNILVVHHDDTVDRMTDGTGSISSMTLSQIKNLNIDTGNNIELYENLKIPTLEEMLIEVKKNDLFAMIHIYDGDVDEILRLINKYRLNMRVVISCYDTNVLKEIRALDHQIALSKIAGSNPSVDIPIAVELGNCMIVISWYAVTTENIELAHSSNLLVVTDTCYNLNRYNEIKSKNIDIVLSDILI